MVNSPKPFLLLENRPILCSALLDRIRGGGGGEFAQFNDYADLAKNIHPDSICFLAVHLLPVDVPIPSLRERAVSVVYGENFTPNCVHWWLDRGAVGIWDLKDSFEDIQSGLSSVTDGKPVLSRSIEKVVSGSDLKVGMHRLSKRELQVAKMLVLGNSTREVAKQLGVTEGTIKNQRKSVYRKLGIVRSSQLPHAMGNGFAHLQK